MENIMTDKTSTRLTDALERDLLAKAMENQFRFRPLRAVGTFFNDIASFVATARTQTSVRDMV
jgi:hypothetical protein